MSSNSLLVQLSVYSHVVMVMSVIMLSAYAVSFDKGLMYLLWLLVASAIRLVILYARHKNSTSGTSTANTNDTNAQGTFEHSQSATCSSGPYMSPTFSTFVMSFTAMYFLMPMFMAGGSQINFGLILMFIAAIVYDGMIKTSAEHCGPSLVKDAVGSNVVTGGGPETINMKTFMADAVGGAGLGSAIAAFVFHSGIKGTLFLHDTNSDGETCSVPTQQQFKCRMYKNGQLVQ
jgi:hypothetical protein